MDDAPASRGIAFTLLSAQQPVPVRCAGKLKAWCSDFERELRTLLGNGESEAASPIDAQGPAQMESHDKLGAANSGGDSARIIPSFNFAYCSGVRLRPTPPAQ